MIHLNQYIDALFYQFHIFPGTLSKDGLWDELDDIVDEKYYEGETVVSSGKEFIVVSSEKRGGLTTYTMDDGSKIGHRDLRWEILKIERI